MKRRPSHLTLGISVLLIITQLASAGPFGKNYSGKATLIPKAGSFVEERPRHRLGVNATGGFNIEAEFLSHAFTKKKPAVDIYRDPSEEEDDFSAGFEIYYEHLLSDPGADHLWGLRAGIGYNRIEIEERFAGLSGLGNLVTFEDELDADLIYLNVGPFYEHRFTEKFYAQLSAGITAAYIDADLVTTVEPGPLKSSGGDDDFLIGAYASLGIGYDFAPNWGLMGGIRYQYLDRFEVSNDFSEAKLNFDSSYFLFLGLRWSF